MNDNSPLNNSCSALEEGFWKRKELTEKESLAIEDFTEQFNGDKHGKGNSSLHQPINFEDCLSDMEVHKNPNLYKDLKSISYSVCDRSASPIANNLLAKQHTKAHINCKQEGYKESDCPSGQQSITRKRVGLVNPKWSKQTVSERNMERSKWPFNEKRTPPICFNLLNEKKLFQQSEKWIKVDEQMIKNKFKLQTNMSKFNNGQCSLSISANKPLSKQKGVDKHKKSPQKNLFEQSFKEECSEKSDNAKLEEMVERCISSIDQKQFSKYKNLLAILISLFVVGHTNEKYQQLNREERQILKIIMYRKFRKHVDIK
jgi:hypothetical protein